MGRACRPLPRRSPSSRPARPPAASRNASARAHYCHQGRDTVIWGRGIEGDDSGIQLSEVPKRASVSLSAERARGRQRGPRPGLAHSGDSSWASVDAPPRRPAARP
ncbi:hypothetical protein HPG69_014113, partial [Diceros bicornis minor]